MTMFKKFIPLAGLILISCGSNTDESTRERSATPDNIIGKWEEVLDGSSQYDRILWTFSPEGDMQLNFDDYSPIEGQWSPINNQSGNRYSFNFQQYPDAAKRLFFVELNYSPDFNSVSILGESTTFHWVSNRSLIKIEE